MTPYGYIGKNGKLPWKTIPEDMALFRELTMGKPCIMGRKTWDSLKKPLKGRRNIILSRSMNLTQELYDAPYRICIVRTPAEAIHEAFGTHGTEEAFVIGGAEIYSILGPLCDEMHITIVHRDVKINLNDGVEFPQNGLLSLYNWSLKSERWIAEGVEYRHYTRKPCSIPTTPDTSIS